MNGSLNLRACPERRGGWQASDDWCREMGPRPSRKVRCTRLVSNVYIYSKTKIAAHVTPHSHTWISAMQTRPYHTLLSRIITPGYHCEGCGGCWL